MGRADLSRGRTGVPGMTRFSATSAWDPRANHNAFTVGWTEGDRQRYIWVGKNGTFGPAIFCLPIKPDRVGGRKARRLDPTRKAHAHTLKIIAANMPRLMAEAKALHAAEVENFARRQYVSDTVRFVEQLHVMSPKAAERARARLDAGEGLESIKGAVRGALDEAGL